MTNLSELEMAIAYRRRQLDAYEGEMRSVLTRAKAVKEEREHLSEEVATLEKAAALLNSIGEERQLKAQDTIESLVTRGLQQIFDESLSFHIIQKVKANAASVEFVVRTTLADGGTVDTPVMEARGGGLAATIGFLLRVVILLLKNGSDTDTTMVLDETFAHVSAEYLPNLAAFIRELIDNTSIQVIMVTHQEELTDNADKVYRFTAVDGKTKVEEV